MEQQQQQAGSGGVNGGGEAVACEEDWGSTMVVNSSSKPSPSSPAPAPLRMQMTPAKYARGRVDRRGDPSGCLGSRFYVRLGEGVV